MTRKELQVKIITDSTSDLSDDILKKYDIDVLPLYVHMGDKEYKDKVNITPDEIYKWSNANKSTPKTSAPSIDDVILAIKPYKEKNKDIIMFAISENMSTTANVMRLAADELDYSNHVFVVDSASLSTGIGLLIVEAAVMAKKRVDAAEIVKTIESLKPYVRASFVVDTLTYLHRGGRCSSTSALIGGVLNFKPRIVVNNGKMESDKKYRGNIRKVIMQYAKDMEKELKHAKKDRVFITHSGCKSEIVDSVREYIESLNHFDNIIETRAGSVISSHCGPGTLGILYIANGDLFGPYDKVFDTNHNGIMEDEERIEEAAYIRHIVEEEKIDSEDDGEEWN